MARRLFLLDEDIVERLERAAEDAGKGGWQNLCRDIMRSEVPGMEDAFRRERLRGIASAEEIIAAYRASEEDES